jgi:hypothetical protein
MRKRCVITIILLVMAAILLCSAALADPDELSETNERVVKAQVSLDSCLTRASLQLAGELGLVPLLTRLQDLSEHDKHKRGAPLSPEGTTLRLEITEVSMTTMLQCQEVIAEIESEISEDNELGAALSERRNRAIKTNAIANIFSNGLVAGIGTMLQEPFETYPNSRFEIPGEVVEAAGGLFSGGLGGYALVQANGAKLSSGIKPNMLAKVFKRPNDAETEYPDVIWRYLNTPLPDSSTGVTRRQLLIRHWEELGRIPPLITAKGRTYVRVLSGTIPERKTITIDMLDDRTAMLADVRAEVSQIYKELLNIMLVVRAL